MKKLADMSRDEIAELLQRVATDDIFTIIFIQPTYIQKALRIPNSLFRRTNLSVMIPESFKTICHSE